MDWLYLYQTSEIVSFKISQYCRMENQMFFFLIDISILFFSNEHSGKMDKIIFLETKMILEPKLYMNGHYIVPGTVFNIESYEKIDKNFEIYSKIDRKHLWKVLYKISSFHCDPTKTWMPWAIFVSDWQGGKSLNLGGTMNCYFVGMMFGRSCTKFILYPHS